MKTIFKMILPILAFTLASAAAVSTNNSKVEEAKNPVTITGYIQDPSPLQCLPVSVNCTEVNTGQACMSNEVIPRQVFKKNSAHACSDNLYKVL